MLLSSLAITTLARGFAYSYSAFGPARTIGLPALALGVGTTVVGIGRWEVGLRIQHSLGVSR